MAIREYKVVTGGEKSPEKAASQLEERVNHAIADGWIPHGSVVSVPHHGTTPGSFFFYLAQPMTR
jgi:hypothetical protein